MKRPNLYLSEHALNDAMRALDLVPDSSLSTEEAERVIEASLVASEWAARTRDEFARFIREAEAAAAAKDAEAEAYARPLREEAAAIRAGIERMKASALRVMERVGQPELVGEVFTIRRKESRGKVAVVDESAIPPEFFRVREDEDLEMIRDLAEFLRLVVIEEDKAIDAHHVATYLKKRGLVVISKEAIDIALEGARRLVSQAEAGRRSVDKVAIQDHWKVNGETRPAEGEERKEMVARGAEPVVPTVPGVFKDVTVSLEIK